MVVLHSYELAIFLVFVTMLCWGSWANTQKMTRKQWPFQLFYWDYAIGVLLLALLAAFTSGSTGIEGRSFMADLAQASGRSLFLAFLGGVIFNLANILLVTAIAIAGMAVAFPIGIGLALVLGVISNYVTNPFDNPTILFIGVALIVVAMVLNARAYQKLAGPRSLVSARGIMVSLMAGFLMGFFYRFVAESMATDFSNPLEGMLTPYTASVIFSLGLFVSTFIWNSIFMYKPLAGKKVTYSNYFRNGSIKIHLTGILGGAIWSLGMILNLIASELAGYTIAYGLGQGAVLIAALWGIFVWKEFNDAKGVTGLLTGMFLFLIAGLTLIIISGVY